ncbi:hypothetical protein BABINDRAFT_12955 [Babjeviella inositovora NRRL Y-12698]|uniref:Outer spore wall assembly protein SHE10 n=1 Tax=Babjeviella inositovora NRRL Y-12698 TaxID=984486 RepID=A0A1E3QT44_9ASCO|nr:uncharacterized protein BABINDRAFT_12955 [Babjeviella inositovora NRRL Y-12698]ODQ80851.1 hypothetical protein BABINDRAFT_12955 [Babjeviella inositovora NRRL Y-12698]
MVCLLRSYKLVLVNILLAYVTLLAFWKCPSDGNYSGLCPAILHGKTAIQSHELYAKHVEPLVQQATPFVTTQLQNGQVVFQQVQAHYDAHWSEKMKPYVAHYYVFVNSITARLGEITKGFAPVQSFFVDVLSPYSQKSWHKANQFYRNHLAEKVLLARVHTTRLFCTYKPVVIKHSTFVLSKAQIHAVRIFHVAQLKLQRAYTTASAYTRSRILPQVHSTFHQSIKPVAVNIYQLHLRTNVIRFYYFAKLDVVDAFVCAQYAEFLKTPLGQHFVRFFQYVKQQSHDYKAVMEQKQHFLKEEFHSFVAKHSEGTTQRHHRVNLSFLNNIIDNINYYQAEMADDARGLFGKISGAVEAVAENYYKPASAESEIVFETSEAVSETFASSVSATEFVESAETVIKTTEASVESATEVAETAEQTVEVAGTASENDEVVETASENDETIEAVSEDSPELSDDNSDNSDPDSEDELGPIETRTLTVTATSTLDATGTEVVPVQEKNVVPDEDVNIKREIEQWKASVIDISQSSIADLQKSISEFAEEVLKEIKPVITQHLQNIQNGSKVYYKQLNEMILKIESDNLDPSERQVSRQDARDVFAAAHENRDTNSDSVKLLLSEKTSLLQNKINTEKQISIDVLENFSEVSTQQFLSNLVNTYGNKWEDWKQFYAIKNFLFDVRDELFNFDADLVVFERYLQEVQHTLHYVLNESGEYLAILRAKANLQFQLREERERKRDEAESLAATKAAADASAVLEAESDSEEEFETIYNVNVETVTISDSDESADATKDTEAVEEETKAVEEDSEGSEDSEESEESEESGEDESGEDESDNEEPTEISESAEAVVEAELPIVPDEPVADRETTDQQDSEQVIFSEADDGDSEDIEKVLAEESEESEGSEEFREESDDTGESEAEDEAKSETLAEQ